MHAHMQLRDIYVLDVTHVIKCTRFSPSIVERAWVRGYMYLPATKLDKVYLGLIKIFMASLLTDFNISTETPLTLIWIKKK